MQRSDSPVSPDDIDIAALGRAVWARKRILIAVTLVTGLVAYGVLSMVTPRYTSQADILIASEDSAYRRPATETADRDRVVDEHAVASQVQVLLSRDLAEVAIEELKLADNSEFASSAGLFGLIGSGQDAAPERRHQSVLDNFAERLSVYQVGSSRVIAVRFTSQDPATAAQVANTMAQVYLGWQQREGLRQTREAGDWLSRQIEELQRQVAESEAKVEEFRSATGLFAGRDNVALSAQQLSELNSQLILARAQRSEAVARASLIDTMLKETGDVDAASDVLRSELIQRLLEQRVRVQRQIAELSATLLPSHPRIQQLRSELTDLRQQIQDEAAKIVRSLENEAQISGAREQSLRNSLEELKAQQGQASANEIELRALEREARANRELLEAYLARHRDASARRDELSVPAEASIISRARAANTPSFPRKGPMTLLAMAAAALLSFSYVLGRELITAPGRNTSGVASRGMPGRQVRSAAPPPPPPFPGETGAATSVHAADTAASERAPPEPVAPPATAPEPVTTPAATVDPAAAPVPESEPEPAADPESEPKKKGWLAIRDNLRAGPRDSKPDDEVPAPSAKGTFPEILNALQARLNEGGPRRILLIDDGPGREASQKAIDIARALEDGGRSVALVDLSTGRPGLSGSLSLPRAPGIHDVAAGSVSFEKAVHVDPDSSVQVYPSGAARLSTREGADRLAEILGALDAAYGCVVLFADADSARQVAEVSQGALCIAVAMRSEALAEVDWRARRMALGLTGFGVPAVQYGLAAPVRGLSRLPFLSRRRAAAV